LTFSFFLYQVGTMWNFAKKDGHMLMYLIKSVVSSNQFSMMALSSTD